MEDPVPQPSPKTGVSLPQPKIAVTSRYILVQTRRAGFRPRPQEKAVLKIESSSGARTARAVLQGSADTFSQLGYQAHMPDILRTSNFVETAAQSILNHAARGVVERGQFFLALSGGGTPKAIYQKLAELNPDTSKWIITFGDERCVPPDDAQSNYRMAREAWLDQTKATVLRMKGELDPASAAWDYEQQLACYPDFRQDLILLGMGDDGHTASLFPGSAALAETKRRVVENYVPNLGVWRITLTFPFINAARSIMFLVNGKAKQPMVENILRGGTGYPSERIAPVDGKLLWLLGE